jgi:hypothetical protein
MDPGLVARMNECSDLVRSLDGLLGRLEKHFRSATDSSQLTQKQGLLDSVSDSFQVRLVKPLFSPRTPRFVRVEPLHGAILFVGRKDTF